MTCGIPPTPVKSTPELPRRIQSIKLCPGAKAVLFRGFPVKKKTKVEIYYMSFYYLFYSKLH